MFGNYSKTLDPKNRVIVPAKLRKELGSSFYLTVGPDKIIEARDAKSFEIFQTALLSNNMLNASAREFARLLLGNTEKVEVDKQGRIVLPRHLLESALITKDVVWVGVGNKVELWPADSYKKQQDKFKDIGSLDDLAKKLMKDGAKL